MKKVVLSCLSASRTRISPWLLSCVLVASGFSAEPISKATPATKSTTSAAHALASLPVVFEENRGQATADARFVARGAGYSLTLKAGETLVRLQSKADAQAPAELRTRLVGAQDGAKLVGMTPSPTHVSYLKGKDRQKWISEVPTFTTVQYRGVYPGVDLNYYGRDARIEYDYLVRPGADPRVITMELNGATRLTPMPNGDVKVELGSGAVTMLKPVAYQDLSDGRHAVEARFLISDKNRIRFQLGAYDANQTLVIDPVITYATFIGTTSVNITAIALDTSKNLFFVASANEGGFGTNTPFCPVLGSNPCATSGPTTYSDVAAGELDASGNLLWVTFVGGSADDVPSGGVTVDGVGTPGIVFGGTSYSTDYPTIGNALMSTCASCSRSTQTSAGFLTKLSLDGKTLVYSTYIRGSNGTTTVGSTTALTDGTLVATGSTTASDLPTSADAYLATRSGVSDAFLMKFAAPSYAMSYSTLFGGGASDAGSQLTTSGSDIWMVGTTKSADLPKAGSASSSPTSAGFWNGYIQTGGDDNWYSYYSGLTNRNATAVSIDPVAGLIFLSVKDGRSLFVSSDGGFTWNHIGGAFQNRTPGHVATSALRLGPNSWGSPTYFVAVPGMGVFQGDITSATWTSWNSGIAAPYNVKEVSADPFSDFLLVYGSSTVSGSTPVAGVGYYGSSSTSTWTGINFNGTVTSNVDISGVSWDQQIAGLVWIYVQGGSVPTGLWRSTDHGQTFTLSNAAAPAAKNIWAGPLDPTTLQPQVFLIDGSYQLEYGINGQNFTALPLPNAGQQVTSFAYAMLNGAPIYFAGTLYGDVWQSPSLPTWISATYAYYIPQQPIQDLAVAANNTPYGYNYGYQHIYAASTEPQMAFVAHMTAANVVDYSQYFAASGDITVSSIALDATGVLMAGATRATDLPSSYYYPFVPGYQWNTFATQFYTAGGYAYWTEYLGADYGTPGIAVDAWGNAVVTGTTQLAMSQASTTGGLQPAPSTFPEGYLVRIGSYGNPSYFSYLGGSGADSFNAVATDLDDNIYIGGSTGSPDLLTGILPAGTTPPAYTGGGTGGVLMKIDMQNLGNVNLSQKFDFSPSNQLALGQAVAGDMVISNSGPGTATNIVATIDVPPVALTGFTFTGLANGICSLPQPVTAPNHWTCAVGSLAPGQTYTITYTATASLTAASDDIYSVLSQTETNLNSNYTYYSYVSASAVNDFSVTFTPPGSMTAGTPAPLVFTVTNISGSVNAPSQLTITVDPTWYLDHTVTITDPMSANHSNSCYWSTPENVAICYLAVDPGNPVTVSVNATATQAGTFPVAYLAAVTSGVDPNLADNSGSTPVTVGAGAAPTGGSAGTDFWVAFPANGDQSSANMEIAVSPLTSANGSILTRDGTLLNSFTLSGGYSQTFTITPAMMETAVGSPENKGIHITATDLVTVFVTSQANQKSDAYLALPTSTLGTDYYTAHIDALASADSAVGTSHISVIGTQNGTSVTITPTANAGSLTAGTPTTFTLDEGQTYYLESASDLTNTHITATHPIAVLSGNKCATINLGSTAPTDCNFLVEELTPQPMWGQNFGTPDAMGRAQGYLLKVIAPSGTVVNSEVNAPVTIGSKGWVDLPVSSFPQRITTSQKAEVFLFTEGSTATDFPNSTMILLPPMETWSKQQTYGTPQNGYNNIYFAAIGPAGFAYVDPPLAAVSFTNYVYSTGAVYGRTLSSTGYQSYYSYSSQATTPDAATILEYGTDAGQTFGAPGAIAPFTAASSPSLTLTSAGGVPLSWVGTTPTPSSVTVDTGTCLTATAQLTGGANAPISFAMYGPAVGISRNAEMEQADGTGLATANSGYQCITAYKGGASTLVASSGTSVSGSLPVHWRANSDLSTSLSYTAVNAAPGATLPFEVYFYNATQTQVKDVTLTVSSSNGEILTFLSGNYSEYSISYSCTSPGTTVICTIPLLPGYGNDYLKFSLTAAAPGGTVTSVITSSDPDWFDPNLTNNTSASAYVTGTVEDLYVTYTPPSGTQALGVPYTYTLTVGNNGPGNVAYNYQLTETLPPYSAVTWSPVAPGTQTCSLSGENLNCVGSALAAGTSEAIQVTLTPVQSGDMHHAVKVNDYYSSSVVEAYTANNSAEMTVRVAASPSMSDALMVMDRDSESISFFDTSGNLMMQLPPAAPTPTSIALSPNGRTLFVAYGNAPYISVYDLQVGKEIHRIQSVRSAAIGVTTDGQMLIVGSLDSDDVLFYNAATFVQMYDVSVNSYAGDSYYSLNDIFMRGMVVTPTNVYIGAELNNLSANARVLNIVLNTVATTPTIYSYYLNAQLPQTFANQFAISQDYQWMAVNGLSSSYLQIGYTYASSTNEPAGQDCGVALNRTADPTRQYMFACSGTTLQQFSLNSNNYAQLGLLLNSTTLPFNPADSTVDGSTLFVIGRHGEFAALDVNTLAPITLATTPALVRPRSIQTVLINRFDVPSGLPVITSVSPTTVPDGQSNVITINGSNFASDAMVRIGRQDLPATYVNSGQLTVTLPNGSPIGANFDVIVVNPTSGNLQGQDSAAVAPTGITITPAAALTAGEHILTSSLGSGRLSDYVTGRIGDRPFGTEVYDFAVSGNGNLVYGPSWARQSIVVTDFVQGRITNTFNLQNGPGTYVGAVQTVDPVTHDHVLLVLDLASDTVTNQDQDALSVIDIEPASANYNQVIKTIPANTHDLSQIGAIAAKSDGTAAYVSVVGSDGVSRLLVFDLVNQLGGNLNLSGFLYTNKTGLLLSYLYVTPDNNYLLMGDGDPTVLDVLNISGANAFNPSVSNRFGINGSLLAGTQVNGPQTTSTRAASGPRRSSTPPFSPSGATFNFDRYLVDATNGFLYAMDHSHEPPVVAQIPWNVATGSFNGTATKLTLTGAHGSWLGAGLALSADGSRLYAVAQTDDALSIINTTAVNGGFVELGRLATSEFPSGVMTTTAAVPSVNISAAFTAPSESVNAGGTTPIGVLVTNTGSTAATNVSLEFDLPTGVQFDNPLVSSCTASGQVVTCPLGGFAAAQSQTVQIQVRSATVAQQTISAFVSAAEADANPADNLTTMYLYSSGCLAPAGYNKTWLGGDSAAPQDWNAADNWYPAGVPAATDNVYICNQSVTQPMLTSAATINNVLMYTQIITGTRPEGVSHQSPLNQAMIDIGTNALNVNGNFAGNVIGTGFVNMAGTSTVQGSIDNLNAPGALTMSGNLNITGFLTVTNAGTFTIGGNTLSVGQELTTTSTATIDLSNGAGILNTKDIIFGGGASHITAGNINVSGQFQAYGGAFMASGTNTVTLNGSTLQPVTITGTSQFANLTITNPTTIQLAGTLNVTGRTSFSSASTRLIALGLGDGLITGGMDVHGLYTNGTITINGSSAGVDVNNVQFGPTPDGLTLLTINYTTGTFNFNNVQFASGLTTGYYVGANGAIVVNMNGSSAPIANPRLSTTGGAVINWPTNPAPNLSTAAFNNATTNGGAPVLATGSSFQSFSVVNWDGQPVATSYVDSSHLQATVPAGLLTSGGHSVTVYTGGPGGGVSTAVILQLSKGAYSVTNLNPLAVTVGGPSFPIQVTGTGFNSGSVVLFNGSPRTTTFVSNSELRATLSAADIATPTSAQIAVQSTAGLSNALIFTVAKQVNPPAVSNFQPANATAGSTGGPLAVIGNNFTLNSAVLVNGASRPTTFVSSTRLTAQLTAADVASSGSMSVTVSDANVGQSVAASYAVSDFGTAIDNASIAVAKNSSGSANLTLTPKLGSYDGVVAFSCSGLPAGLGCTFSPATITPGANPATVKVTVGFTTTAAMHSSLVPLFAMLSFGCFGVLVIGGSRRRLARVALLGAALLLIAMVEVGCGGGSGAMTSPNPTPNPAVSTTNYPVTITATSGSLSHSTTVTVSVTQ